MANLDQDHGVIAQLINLPEDDSNRRFLIALLASLGLNAAAIIAVNVVSQLHNDPGKNTVAVAKPVNLTFDNPKEIQPEKKPEPEPTPKPVRRPRPKTKSTPIVKPRKPIERKPVPQPTPKPQEPENTPTPEPKAEPTPEPVKPKPTVKNTAAEKVANAAQPTTVTNNAAVATNLAPGAVGRVTTNNNAAARSVNNASEAVRTNEVSTSVSATATDRSFRGGVSATLAGGGARSSVAATTERSESATVASSGGGAVSLNRPSDIRRTSNVAGAQGGAVRGGSSGFSASEGSTAVASISTPSFVGRRGPAIGNTSIVTDSKAVLTSAMSDEGRANSGLATIQGAKGTVATSIALRQNGGVTGSSAGRAGVGGGRNIGSASESSASISGSGGAVGARGPANGSTRLADNSTGRGNVGAASEGDGRGTGISGGTGAAGAAGAGRVGGGTGGPRSVAGSAGSGGGGGAGVRAGGADDATVEAKNNNTEEKKPVSSGNKEVIKTNSDGAAKRNQDAEPTSDPNPELTSDMKKRQFNANVRVKVTVEADGSHTEELTSGTGDDEIDALVLKTMRRWKWRPAYRDGEKVKMTVNYRFKINVNG